MVKLVSSHNNTAEPARVSVFEGSAMLVRKGHRIQLLPNNAQRMTFVQWAGTHRWVWNYGLECKIKAFEQTGKSPGAYALSKEIVELKHTSCTWLRDVSKSVPRMALQQLDRAYASFFRRNRNSEKEKGFPKFKSRKRSKTVFHIEPDQVRIEGKRIRLPKIGWVRMTKPLRFEGKLVGTVAINKQAGKWYASLNVKTKHVSAENQSGTVGIDLGVKSLATLSDGIQFENPKALRRYRKLLARAQRQLERKQKGSNRWEKAKLRVQRIHKRIADVRANATHHATRHIADTYSFVAMETLNVSGMMKNCNLAGAIADANFYEFKRQVVYKVRWGGHELTLIDQWFPSSKTCSVCGCVNDGLTLSDRAWTCACGAIHDRDKNAAKNILAKGLQDRRGLPVAGRGGIGSVSPPNETPTKHIDQTLMGEERHPSKSGCDLVRFSKPEQMEFSRDDLYRRFKVAFLFRERLIGGIPKTADTELMKGWLRGQKVPEEAIAEIAETTAQEMAEQAIAETIRAGWSGFKMRDGKPVVEARQLKALLKEVANVSGDTRHYLGLKNLFQHGLFIRPKYIPLLLPEARANQLPAFTERVVHTFRGSSIKRADYVDRPQIEFEVGVIASNPIVARQKIRKAGDLLFDALLLKLFLLGEEDGLGAWRTQGEGKFDLIEFARIS